MSPSRLFESDIRGVLFDWGDTLVHPPGITTDPESNFGCVEEFYKKDMPIKYVATRDGDHEKSWPAFCQNYQAVAAKQIQETLETGKEHSFEQRFKRALHETFPDAQEPDDNDLAWMARRFGERVASECWQISHAEAVLPQLRNKFSIGLLSNYPHPPAVYQSLEHFDLLSHIDTVTVSGAIGWAKPDARAFEHAIGVMELSAEQVLYVGDDLVNDMQGAKTFGMSTAWLPRRGQTGQHEFVDVTLSNLTDLLRLLPQSQNGTQTP